MKLFDKIKLIVGAGATVYYSRADEQTQLLTDMIIKGHETILAIKKDDLSAKSIDQLMGDIRHFVLIEGGYTLLLAKFDIGSEDLARLSDAKRLIIETAVRTQHKVIKNHLLNLLEQLKTRFQ